MVVEDRYSKVFTLERVRPALVADGLAELRVRYPTIPIVFCETRKLAEELDLSLPGCRPQLGHLRVGRRLSYWHRARRHPELRPHPIRRPPN